MYGPGCDFKNLTGHGFFVDSGSAHGVKVNAGHHWFYKFFALRLCTIQYLPAYGSVIPRFRAARKGMRDVNQWKTFSSVVICFAAQNFKAPYDRNMYAVVSAELNKVEIFLLSKNICVTMYSAPESTLAFRNFISLIMLGASKCFRDNRPRPQKIGWEASFISSSRYLPLFMSAICFTGRARICYLARNKSRFGFNAVAAKRQHIVNTRNWRSMSAFQFLLRV